jgi:hypothetical protein
MFKDHEWVIAVIENEKNEINHIDGIFRLTKLFNEKWYNKNLKDFEILRLSQFVLEQQTKLEKLKIKLNGNETKI